MILVFPQWRWLVLLSAGWMGTGIASAAEAVPDFITEVRPILSKHCWNCHGPLEQKGNLRLDSYEALQKGGHLSQNLLERKADANPLLKRLRTDDQTLRMPQGQPPLAAEEQKIIERWLLAGAKYAEAAVETKPPLDIPWWERWNSLVDLPTEHLYPAIGLTMVFLLFILLLERGRQNGTQPTSPWLWRKLATYAVRIGHGGYFGMILTGLSFGLISQLRFEWEKEADLRRELTTARNDASRGFSNNNCSLPMVMFDSKQPQPLRPHHPRRLGGIYYRGNDERSDQLYNGGFYRTATMEVYLVDSAKKQLAWNDPFPTDGKLFIHLTIKKAPFATPSLFTPELMGKILLSHSCSTFMYENVADDLIPLTVVEEGEHWEAMYPLANIVQNDRKLGIVYIQQGAFENGALGGTVHFGIGYNILIEEGKISPSSELWLGTIVLPANFVPLNPKHITFYEWFDFRPIPEIEGGNTIDPKLLGVEQYLGKQPQSEAKRPVQESEKTKDSPAEPQAKTPAGD